MSASNNMAIFRHGLTYDNTTGRDQEIEFTRLGSIFKVFSAMWFSMPFGLNILLFCFVYHFD